MKTKTIIGIVGALVILVVMVLVISWGWGTPQTPQAIYIPPTTPNNPTNSQVNTQANSQTTAATMSSDTSDAALIQDMANIDTQINGLNTDTASADQALGSPNQ